MNQTMASVLPSVVVVMGEWVPRMEVHQATSGLTGAPGTARTETITRPLGPPAGQVGMLLTVKAMCTPLLEVYAVGAVKTFEPPAITKSASWPPMPPRRAASRK